MLKIVDMKLRVDTEEEARKKIENDPFNYLKIGYPIDDQELGVKDIEFKE